jgi:fibronectin-binding autotransporter adhesin
VRIPPPLTLEKLEDRLCPSLTASLQSGTLAVSGTANNGSISVVQDSTTPGTVKVFDGNTAVGSPFTGVNNVRLNLTGADDKVTVDLGGQKLSGGVTANLGAGTNSLAVVNGSLGGALQANAGAGNDTVTLGDGTKALSLTDVGMILGGGTNTVAVHGKVNVLDSLAAFGAGSVTTDVGSTVKDLFVRSSQAGSTVNLNGGVTGNAAVDAFFLSGSSAGTTVNVTGAVGGNFSFLGSNQADTLHLAGTVGKSVAASLYGGADTVTIDGAINGSLALDTGAGADKVTLNSTVGGKTAIDTGDGNDVLTITAKAKLQGAAAVEMGAGNDSVTLDNAATISTLLIDGGPGTNTFTGTKNRPGLTLIDF